MNRQIVLDVETTGLEPAEGHRIIEIGAVELVDRKLTRNRFHHYIDPERTVDQEALDVHGISNEFLADKPKFAELARQLIEFIKDAELIIHNAEFDVGFLDHELSMLGPEYGVVADHASVLDSLELARQMHPGMKNSLDALCKRYEVDNSDRNLHGALLDAKLLAEVYLRMTGGQTTLALEAAAPGAEQAVDFGAGAQRHVHVVRASEAEIAAHEERLAEIDKLSGGKCLWNQRRVEAELAH